jgi:uncharacterized protein YbbK (DUF523 family)/uncharacterized protein YbgA (DUF1722 family)
MSARGPAVAEAAGRRLPRPAFPKIRIGISSCLLGEAVRWDGGHKRDRYITRNLGERFEWVPVCPEYEVGMGIPREPVRLVGTLESPRMVGVWSKSDWTARMRRYSRERIRRLEELDLSGYLLKSGSPSCGMERVRVYRGKGRALRKGRGLFAGVLRERLPLLPIEEEGRLRDPAIRESFLERVFAYRRWRELEKKGCRRDDLAAFHTAHRFLILSHSPRHEKALGGIVAALRRHRARRSGALYGPLFLEALRIPATVRRHHRVLLHLAGFLKVVLSPQEKRKLEESLEAYRGGRVRRVVLLALLKRHLRRHEISCPSAERYLDPEPKEWVLRNQV